MPSLTHLTVTAGKQAFDFISTATFGIVAGQLRHEFNGADRTVEGDLDGDGLGDFQLLLRYQTVLTQAEFIL